MPYRIELSERAAADIDEAYVWLAGQSTQAANRWLVSLEKAIASLQDLPSRCPLAPEAAYLATEARHLLHGRPPHMYRIVFEVRDDTVSVLRVLHSARLPR